MKHNRLTIVAVLVAMFVLGLWFGRYLSPERVVQRKLLQAVEAFESEQLLGTMHVVSRQYSDPWGQSYESVAGNLSEMMATFDDLGVEFLETAADTSEEGVLLRLRFVVSGRDGNGAGTILGSRSDPCTASIFWRKESSGWHITTTESLDIPELRDELDALHRGP